MIFPMYFAQPTIELPTPTMEMSISSLDSLDKALKDCPTCKPMVFMKDGSRKELDHKTFQKLLKHLRKIYAENGNSM